MFICLINRKFFDFSAISITPIEAKEYCSRSFVCLSILLSLSLSLSLCRLIYLVPFSLSLSPYFSDFLVPFFMPFTIDDDITSVEGNTFHRVLSAYDFRGDVFAGIVDFSLSYGSVSANGTATAALFPARKETREQR